MLAWESLAPYTGAMSARPWYSLGHMVRMLAADLLLAMVTVALLVCNIRGDHAVFLPMVGGMDKPGLLWANRPRWQHGWPLACLERCGAIVDTYWVGDGTFEITEYAEITRARTGEHWTFNVTALTIDVLVALVMLGSTAYATRRWLQTGMRLFQVSLLTLLTLLVVPAFVYLFSELPGMLPHLLLAAFLWLGIVCTLFVVMVLVARLLRRLSSTRT